jgi:hypothetical protein
MPTDVVVPAHDGSPPVWPGQAVPSSMLKYLEPRRGPHSFI